MQLAIFLVRVAAVVGRKGIHIDVSGHREVSLVEHYDPSAVLRAVLEVLAESIDADEGLGGRVGGEGEKAKKDPKWWKGWYAGIGELACVRLLYCVSALMKICNFGRLKVVRDRCNAASKRTPPPPSLLQVSTVSSHFRNLLESSSVQPPLPFPMLPTSTHRGRHTSDNISISPSRFQASQTLWLSTADSQALNPRSLPHTEKWRG